MEASPLSIELQKSLPEIDLSEDILDYWAEVLQRPRTFYRLLSQNLDLANGRVFITLPLHSKLDSIKLNDRGPARRGDSIQVLKAIFSMYLKMPLRTVFLDNGMHQPSNRALTEYEHEYRFLSVENGALYSLDRDVAPEDMEDFIMKGACGSSSVGMLTNFRLKDDNNLQTESASIDSLIAAARKAEAVIFSVCDSEAFALWCPESPMQF